MSRQLLCSLLVTMLVTAAAFAADDAPDAAAAPEAAVTAPLPETPTFGRACYILAEPSNRADRVCLKQPGAPISSQRSLGNDWALIETPDCSGYVADDCIADPDYRPRQPLVDAPHSRRDTVRLAFLGQINGNLGSVNSDNSRGDGYGVLFRVQVPVFNRIRLSFTPSFQTLGLARSVDMTGALKDPNPPEFTHTIKFLGIGASAEWIFLRNYADGKPTSDPELSVELGTEFLIPLSATQTDSITGGSISFTSKDKPLLLYTGLNLDIGLQPHFSVLMYLNLYYNLRSANGNSFFGGRLGFGIAYAL